MKPNRNSKNFAERSKTIRKIDQDIDNGISIQISLEILFQVDEMFRLNQEPELIASVINNMERDKKFTEDDIVKAVLKKVISQVNSNQPQNYNTNLVNYDHYRNSRLKLKHSTQQGLQKLVNSGLLRSENFSYKRNQDNAAEITKVIQEELFKGARLKRPFENPVKMVQTNGTFFLTSLQHRSMLSSPQPSSQPNRDLTPWSPSSLFQPAEISTTTTTTTKSSDVIIDLTHDPEKSSSDLSVKRICKK